MIYISLINWKKRYRKALNGWASCQLRVEKLFLANNAYKDEIYRLGKELEELRHASYYFDSKAKRWRDSVTGKIVSANTVLKAEQAARLGEPQPSDNCALAHYDDIKKASKKND